ncbi:MAG: DMT family transporter [Clostridia bacterium]|nr:DMT family transporter [Clostridia bacterium]
MKQHRYEIMLVGCAAFWGLAFPVIKYINGQIDSLSFLGFRFLLADLILLLFYHSSLKNVTKNMLLPCFGLGLLFTAHSFLQIEGLRYTSAANSSFITSTNVIFVPFFMYLFFRQKPTKNIIIGLIAVICGFLLISGIVSLQPLGIHFTTFNYGDFLTLLCALLTALYMVIFNRLAARYDEIAVNLLHMLGATAGTWILWLFYPDKLIAVQDAAALIGILYCGIFATGLAFLLLAKAQAKTEASKVAILSSLEPVFATIFATFIPDRLGNVDPLSLPTVLGGAFILYGVIKSSVNKNAEISPALPRRE